MASVDVLYEGVLSLNLNPSNDKDWKERLFVLKHENHSATLHYYKDRKKRWQKQEPIGAIPLHPTFKLSLAHECGYKFPLKLVANGQTYYISASSFHNMNAWFHHIQLTRVLPKHGKDSFECEVLAKKSDSMDLIEAHGKCVVALTATNEIVCATLPRRQVLAVWPYDSLRGYWVNEGVFGFEAGRRSPRGEGIFEFCMEKNEQFYTYFEQCVTQLRQGGPRPPLPALNSHDLDTPPVSTSLSDEELPLKPALPQRPVQKAGSVKTPHTGAPNLRRVHTHTGVQKWLHKTSEKGSPSTRRDVSPLSDDTYSHTVHAYPPQRHASPEPGQTYQRLHSRDTPINRPPIQPPSHTLSNLAEEDITYDVAYPDSTERPQIPSDSEYATLCAPDPSRVVRQSPVKGQEGTTLPGRQSPMKAQEVTPPRHVSPSNQPPLPARQISPVPNQPYPIPNQPTPTARGSPIPNQPTGGRHRSPIPNPGSTMVPVVAQRDTIGDEHLIDNPLYNSQDDLLKAIQKLERPKVTLGLDSIDSGIDDLQISPAYELHILRDQTPTAKAKQEDDCAFKENTDTQNHEPSPGQEETEPGAKSTKPYSKVKKKPASVPPEEKDSPESDSPPPLPARLYSMDSTGSDSPQGDSESTEQAQGPTDNNATDLSAKQHSEQQTVAVSAEN